MKELLKIKKFVNFVGSFSTISMMFVCTCMLIGSGCKRNVKSGDTTAVETVSPVDTLSQSDTLVVEDVVEVNNGTCDTDCECDPEETCEGCCAED